MLLLQLDRQQAFLTTLATMPLFILTLFSCHPMGFDSDERQLVAKDVIRKQIGRAESFDIVGFRQDTVANWHDTTMSRPLSYTLDIVYADSSGRLQSKRGVVIFPSSGSTVLSSSIQDR
jgi:hypothetical protein